MQFKPIFHHHCNDCVYLGPYCVEHSVVPNDLYVCNDEYLIIRWGNGSKDITVYSAELVETEVLTMQRVPTAAQEAYNRYVALLKGTAYAQQ